MPERLYCPTCHEPLGNGQKQYDHRCVSLAEIHQLAAHLKRHPMASRGRLSHAGTWVDSDEEEKAWRAAQAAQAQRELEEEDE